MKNVSEKIGFVFFLFHVVLFQQLTAQPVTNDEGADVLDAQFAGGSDQMSLFFTQNMNYPDKAAVRHIEGTVVVVFTVDAAGGIRNPKIREGLGHGCDEEAIRLVQTMPQWQPALLNGKPVATGKTLYIKFKMPY